MSRYPINSLFYWYPKIKDLDIPMPKTTMLPFPSPDTLGALFFDNSEDKQLKEEYVAMVKDACRQMGYPVFLRSDETSHKHGWDETCYLTKEEDIPDHLYELIKFTEMVMGGLDIHGFAIREFMHLDTKFNAFHGKMPVATEFRFFIRDGVCQCYHPYWFPSCMIRPSKENWYDLLLEMEKIGSDTLSMLTQWGEQIGNAVGGYWSIDFCKLKDESWAMTDMANGDNSFHFSTCQYAPEDIKKHYPDPYAKPSPFNLGVLPKPHRIDKHE